MLSKKETFHIHKQHISGNTLPQMLPIVYGVLKVELSHRNPLKCDHVTCSVLVHVEATDRSWIPPDSRAKSYLATSLAQKVRSLTPELSGGSKLIGKSKDESA